MATIAGYLCRKSNTQGRAPMQLSRTRYRVTEDAAGFVPIGYEKSKLPTRIALACGGEQLNQR